MLSELESLSLDQLLQQRQIFNAHLNMTSHLNVEITKALIRKLFVKILDIEISSDPLLKIVPAMAEEFLIWTS